MATLEKIRQRSGLLIIIIGLALLAFILGDMFSGGGFSSDQFKIAEINGVKVDYREYEERLESAIENVKRNTNQGSLDEQTTNQVHDQVWEQLVQELVMGEEHNGAGVAVSVEELKDMVLGNNIHPQIRQIPIFQNEQTGQFDPEKVKAFISGLQNDPQMRETWMAFEQGIKQERINNKYYTAIQKGYFVTDKYAQQEAIEKDKKVDIKYVSLPYTNVKDEEISINDADLLAYYESHKNLFKQEKAVDIEYLSFKVEPSSEDIKNIQADLNELIPEFKETVEVGQFVSATSDIAYDGKYYKQGEYENTVIDSIMFNSEEGTVYGPYLEDNYYKIAKVAHVAERPDTIKVNHIALVPQENQTAAQLEKYADSLVALIENGASFTELAKKHSADEETASKGGDLGWMNVQQLPYGEALLDTEKGGIVKVPTGQAIFIAQMTEKGKSVKQVQLAVVSREIAPSDDTRDKAFAAAQDFVVENNTVEKINKAVEEKGLTKKKANGLKTTTREIAGIGNARSIIREAFKTEENQIIVTTGSENAIFDFENAYIIGFVTKQYHEGHTAFEDVKQTVERAVKKNKKAEVLMAKFNETLKEKSNIDEIAAAVNGTVKLSEGITFGAFSIPGLGIEPVVQGTALAMNKDEISKPLEGNNAVYVIQIANITEPETNQNLAMQKQSIKRTFQSRVQRQVMEVLKDNAEITDNRINFY